MLHKEDPNLIEILSNCAAESSRGINACLAAIKKNSSLLLAAVYTFIIISCNDNGTSESTTESSNTASDTIHQENNTATNTTSSDNSMMKSMDQMMDKMKSVNMTGDFDLDFANLMIEHHKAAVEMSEEELNAGKDEKMKAIAQRIKTTNQEEIDKLQTFLKNHKPSNMKHGEGELQSMMSKMESEMKSMHSNQMTDDMDRNFAMMMTKHHEDGIAMAKKELEHR